MVREYICPFMVEGILLIGLVLGWRVFHVKEFFEAGSIVFFLMVFTFFFFRDPERRIPEGEGYIVSPADGCVVDMREVPYHPFFKGSAKVISIYLSLWDVHVNRVPVSGEIKFLDYHPGWFYPASWSQSSQRNEHLLLGIEGKMGKVIVKQVAGMIARRIVCRLKVGDHVRRGERFGMIKFGSRVDLYIPLFVVLHVSVGERVRGGESIIGTVTCDV